MLSSSPARVLELFGDFGVREIAPPLYDYGKLYAGSRHYPVVFPSDADELADIVRIAAENGVALRVRASGHTFNGASLPREGELLIRMDRLNHFRFDQAGTLTAGAGALVWDVRDLAVEHGFNLPVYNGGWAGPTLGGYLNAGGFAKGGLSAFFGGLWENVEAVTLIDGTGRKRTVVRDEPLFPWLFGSYGQLGIVVEAKLNVLYSSRNTARSYPQGLAGIIPSRQTDDPKINDQPPGAPVRPTLFWFSLLITPAHERRAWHDLEALAAAHAGFLVPTGGWAGPVRDGAPMGYHYVIRFRRFNPPLVYPRPENFLVIGVMSLLPSGDEESNCRLLALERDFIRLALEGGYGLYLQAENFGRNIDFRRYYGDAVFSQFRRWKDECDPAGIFNPGIVFPNPVPSGVTVA